MKKLVITLIVMLAFATNADAQGILGRLKDRAVNAAKNAVERKVEDKVSRETVSKQKIPRILSGPTNAFLKEVRDPKISPEA